MSRPSRKRSGRPSKPSARRRSPPKNPAPLRWWNRVTKTILGAGALAVAITAILALAHSLLPSHSNENVARFLSVQPVSEMPLNQYRPIGLTRFPAQPAGHAQERAPKLLVTVMRRASPLSIDVGATPLPSPSVPVSPTGIASPTGSASPTGTAFPTGPASPTGTATPTTTASPTGTATPTGRPRPPGRPPPPAGSCRFFLRACHSGRLLRTTTGSVLCPEHGSGIGCPPWLLPN